MDDAYARSYRQLYERHWWWRTRERLLIQEIARQERTRPWGSILDVGCGDGLFFDALSTFGTVEGVEPSGHLLDDNEPYRDRIHVGPFDTSFEPGKRYGLILMLDVLEHLEDPKGALEHALRLLEADGSLIVTVPAFRLLWTTHDDINEHLTRYTRKRFSALAERSGLRIDHARYFFHWLFPVKLIVRASEAMFPKDPTPAELPPPLVNQGLIALCRLEHAVLGRLPIPFGSSLLVVGGHR